MGYTGEPTLEEYLVVMTGSAAQPLIDPDTETVEAQCSVPAPGERRRTGRGHVDSFGEGRVCAAPDCATELSRYNPSSACWLHDESVLSVARWAR